MHELYNMRSVKGGWRMVKFECFDNGAIGDIEAEYQLWRGQGRLRCDCALQHAGRRVKGMHCRHTDMAILFFRDGKIDTGWFMDWTCDLWIPPVRFERRLKFPPNQL
jgi:hypothetical protein